jgi:alcohol dehydrogenase class IV
LHFEFATSNHILFGPGVVEEVPRLAREFGHRVFLVHNRSGLNHPLFEKLKLANLDPLPYSVSGEPTIQSVRTSIDLARQAGCDLVIAMGGGSCLDTGKAVAVLLSNPGDLGDYLEIVGSRRAFENPAVPFIAIPTTAGTGSEVTRNAVISIPDQHLKVSLRSPFMLPFQAIVDPELTYGLPPDITAETGLDALTQLIEPFLCIAPTPLTDAVCRDGIPRIARSLLAAYKYGRDIKAREDMSLASLFGGMALANARLGAVHGLASPIGGMIPAPHGAICARLLPFVMKTNLNALRLRQPDSQVLNRYGELASLVTGGSSTIPEDGITWIWNLCHALNIRPLAEFGLKISSFQDIVLQSQKANSMKGNSVLLTDRELTVVLEQAL